MSLFFHLVWGSVLIHWLIYGHPAFLGPLGEETVFFPLSILASFVMKWKKVKSLSRVRLFATPWTVAYQVSLSMGFSRQEYWSGLPWVWVNCRIWWWTGRPGVLRFMGSQRVGYGWATELNWNSFIYFFIHCIYLFVYYWVSGIFILGLAYFCNHIFIMCLDTLQSRVSRKEGEKRKW